MASVVRGSMAPLISELRLLIGDHGTPPEFQDEDLQAVLDRGRREVRYAELTPSPTIAAGGAASYLDYFFDEGGPWEASPTIVDGAYATLSPSVIDLSIGKWTFVANTNPPVYIAGLLYDLHDAAAEVLDTWAMRYARRFDVSADGQEMKRSQVFDMLRKAAQVERGRARPVTIPVYRSDDLGTY